MAGLLVNLVLVVLAAAPFQASSIVRLTGRVVDAATNEPVSGVEITFERTPSAPGWISLRAVTGRTGAFSLDIPSGDYRFLVRRPGYAPAGRNEAATPITVRGPAQAMPEIRLESGGTISGRVVDVRGNPLPRLLIAAVRPAELGSSDRDPADKSVRTNDSGEFRLSGLPSGRYYVAAELPPQPVIASDGAASTAFVATYYPGVTDPSVASLIEVTTGRTSAGIDFSIFEVPMRSVSGIVVDGGDRPIKGAVVMFSRARQLLGISPSVTTDDGGRFRMILPEGDYLLGASIPVTTSGGGRETGFRLGGPGVVPLTVRRDPVSDIRLVAQQNR